MDNDLRLQRSRRLTEVTRELMSDLGKMPLHDRLMLIARRAAEILNAESAGVFRVADDTLVLEASFGHAKGFEPGKVRVPITDTPGHGLTGYIAHRGELFRDFGLKLLEHPAVSGRRAPHTPSGLCLSLLAIPLFRGTGDAQELIGLLRADNKKGADGQALTSMGFDDEDEDSIRSLGHAAVVAIESAELVERLIGSSLNGIIAVDRKGRVIEFNRRAEEVLGYSREEVLSTPVHRLYADPEEPRRIGFKLKNSPGGQILNYETLVRSKDGEEIPILHSSTWLFDAQRRPNGSIGYFADLREQKQLERRESLLRRAIAEVGHAETLDEGLQKLARMMVKLLGRSFCGILLMDPGQESLRLRAASADPGLGWTPQHPSLIMLAHWNGLKKLLEKGSPRIRGRNSRRGRRILDQLTEALQTRSPIHSLLVMPLKIGTRVVGQLSLGELDPARAVFKKAEIELVSAIASQITALIDRMEAKERTFSRLMTLHRISDTIQSIDDLGDVLKVILTGVTAGFGLGFNRAMLFLLDETNRALRGRTGIGEIEEEKAREAWGPDVAASPGDLELFLKWWEDGGKLCTTVGELIHELSLPLSGDLFSEVLGNRCPRFIPVEEFHRVPPAFIDTFRVTTPLVVAPLIAPRQAIGLLVVDNKFTQASISDSDIALLMQFATTAAFAIISDRRKLIAFYRASNELLPIRKPGEVIQKLVELTLSAAGASSVSILLIDAERRVRNPIAMGRDPDPDPEIRDNGISLKVMGDGKAFKVEDVGLAGDSVNPSLAASGARSAICLPLDLAGKRLGVLWIHFSEPRRFPEFEIAALQLFVGQVAVAYDSAQRMERLEHMRKSAELMVAPSDTASVLRQIVTSAPQVLGASAAVVWSYDAERQTFIPERSDFEGENRAAWEEIRKLGPLPDGTAYRIMNSGWVGVADVDDGEQIGILGPRTRKLIVAVKGQRFQGIPLIVGAEKLGVLYMIYPEPWSFDEGEQWATAAFAGHAALALKKARLLEQVQRIKDAAKAVARSTVLGDHRATLASIARETKEALECTSVVVFEYDGTTRRFVHPPVMEGIKNPAKVSGGEEAHPFVYRILERNEPWTGPSVPGEEDFGHRGFAIDEEVGTCIARPLTTTVGKVGVMIVNYRNPRQLTKDEGETIELFAHQAAVAIRDHQLIGTQTKLTRMAISKGVAAHEINRRIGLIRIDVALGLTELPENSEAVADRLKRIESWAAQIQDLVKSLAAELEEGATSVPVNGALRSSWDRTLDLNPAGPPVTLSLSLDLSDTATTKIDPQLLTHILDTLIQNALTATLRLPNRFIRLRTRRRKSRALVYVSDNGPGIPRATRKKLGREPISETSGLGRGLLLAYSVAHMHEGDILCLQRSGTTMIVSLPLEKL